MIMGAITRIRDLKLVPETVESSSNPREKLMSFVITNSFILNYTHFIFDYIYTKRYKKSLINQKEIHSKYLNKPF